MSTIHNQSSNEDLLCCRVCLMTDCRLFYIHQYELSEAFSRISGTPVYKDQLPQYLCTYCSTLLLKCTSFRDMCLRTEQCLKLELLKGELTTDYIRRIDWPQRLHLTLTVAQIVDCIDTPSTDIKKEPNEVIDINDPTIEAGAKSEVNKDTDERNLSESNIDSNNEDNLSESTIDGADEENLSESNIDKANEDNLGESNIDNNDEDNLSESTIDDTDEDNVDESSIDTNDEDNLGESNIDDTVEDNLRESNLDNNNQDNLGKSNIDDTDENNLGESTIDDTDEDNVAESSIDTNDEDNLGESNIDNNNKDNLGKSNIDNNNKDNLGKSNIDNTDENNLVESNIDDTDEDNSDEPNIDEANKDTVDKDCGIRKSDTKTELVNKNDKVKTKHNQNENEDILSVNKAKIVKTYKRNISTTVRKMGIEIQGHSDKVNETIEKNGTEIDLDAASNSNEKINISYTHLYYANIKEYIYESDIDDINAIEERIDIVDVDSIIKKGVIKKKTCTREIATKAKSKDNCDNADTLNKTEGQVKKRRRKKKRHLRNPENDNMPPFDLSKFESDYDMAIVTLNKQEQLEEVALRKQSINPALRFKCEECGKEYDMEAAYNNHRRRHSPSAGEHACEICLVRFKLRTARQNHQDTHRLKFTCKECGVVIRSRWAAREHYQEHKGRRFDCHYCGKRFTKRSSYLTHVRLAHPTMNVVCGDCGETFVSEIGLKLHKAMTHSKNMFKCTTCSASFVSLDALKTHTDTGEHSGRPCEQCGESCASEEALQTHVGERHPTEAHRCEECRATFSSAAAFDIHVRRKHLNQRYKVVARGPRKYKYKNQKRGQFVCEQCGYIAWNSALLRYHQNNHLAVKPFPCSQCPKTFATNGLRKSHERCHKGERPFKCPECPLAFTAKANFQRHHKVVHLGEHDNATCRACERVFTTKGTLRLHINSVHNGQPWPKRNRKRKKVDSH